MTVYTCTMNLAIDLFIETEQLLPHTVNRSIDDDIQANGKGVNVSLILKKLGIDSTATGFGAGFTGKYIEDYLKEKAITTDFVTVPGMTRINVFTQVNETGEEYKLVNQGPEIPDEKKQVLLDKIAQLTKGDYLCVSGSLPKNVSPQILVDISKICKKRGIHFILDSSYAKTMECLQYQPFLLKPNEEELAEWFDLKNPNIEEYKECVSELIYRGAKNVLLSLGNDGAIFVNQDVMLSGNAPKGEVVNTACAGDTLLGTFLAGFILDTPFEENLKLSIAAGSSTAFQKGLTDFSDTEELSQQIQIKKER